MDDYIDPGWQITLRALGLADFQSLWALQADWFEPPNQRRGGWSGVVRLEVPGPEGVPSGFFLKRQENHRRRTLAHPIGGEPTFAAEMRNLMAMRAAGVATARPVFFAQRKIDGRWCVVLMTQELLGFRPLDDWMVEWSTSSWHDSVQTRRRLLAVGAPMLRRMHLAGYAHNALHPKHLFARIDDEGEVEVCLIDLEKMRRKFLRFRTALRDLDSLNRRSRHWSRTDRLRFLKAYLGTGRLDFRGRLLWRLLAKRYAAKCGGAGRA